MSNFCHVLSGLVRQYLSDAINPGNASDSLVYLFQSFDDKNIKYRLAMLYLQRGEYAQGSNVLNAIPSGYYLNIEELLIHDNFEDFYNLVKSIRQTGRTELKATETEIQQLMDIEEIGIGMASIYARNILIALDEIDYLAPIQLPDLTKSAKEMEEYVEIMNFQPPSRLEVFPNPSKDFVIIHYLLEMENEGTIEIKDVNGRLIDRILINRVQDQVTVKTKDWKPGTYIATIKINGNLIDSCKFTIIK